MPQVHQLLRREIDQAGGLSQWSRRKGISRVHLSRVLHGHRPFGTRIIRALGLEAAISPSPSAVLRLLSQEIEKAGSQSEWARRTGVNRSSLAAWLKSRGRLGCFVIFVRDLSPKHDLCVAEEPLGQPGKRLVPSDIQTSRLRSKSDRCCADKFPKSKGRLVCHDDLSSS
jgi:DNA-binding phage protein